MSYNSKCVILLLVVLYFILNILTKDLNHIFSEPVKIHPCNPSPCGPNSRCREINGQAVCSCILGFTGQPPLCRPECIINSDCARREACINQKCIDPCLGSCGINAECKVINHNPICSCPIHYTGNPFIRCQQIRKKYEIKKHEF